MRHGSSRWALAIFAMLLVVPSPAPAQDKPADIGFRQIDPKRIYAGNKYYSSWQAYFASDFFRRQGLRCGTASPEDLGFEKGSGSADCTLSLTNPAAIYDPTVAKYRIPVVVHILQKNDGTGALSDALVQSQIEVLNEDYKALPGTPGAAGTDVQIEFFLATVTPGGNPTTGITRTTNDTWFNDQGSYWTTLAWDTHRYLNVYTNSAGGYLGYAYLAQQGLAGQTSDRVVILHASFGRDSSGGPPYDQGRTLTHEVGHYLGLEHTFEGGCASGDAPACYSSGDLICDTNPESDSASGCPTGQQTCGNLDPIENFMNYSDDTCMTRFTPEQARRMRCTLENYRPDLYQVAGSGPTHTPTKTPTKTPISSTPTKTSTPAPSPSPTLSPTPTVTRTPTLSPTPQPQTCDDLAGPAAIPDGNAAGVTLSITSNDSRTLADLDVRLDINHTWVGDLVVQLTHVETDRTVTLIDRIGLPATSFGCSGNNLQATLDDSAVSAVENQCAAGTPSIQGTFSPNGDLSLFEGENFEGEWRLFVRDLVSPDAGTVVSWCLVPTFEPPPVSFTVWVDFNYSGPEDGGLNTPFNTLAEAVSAAQTGGLIRCKAPAISSEQIRIAKVLRLESSGGLIRLGVPTGRSEESAPTPAPGQGAEWDRIDAVDLLDLLRTMPAGKVEEATPVLFDFARSWMKQVPH